MAAERTKFTVPVLAKMWGVSPSKITAFVRSGELRAINLATKLGGRPRYRIDRADIEAFERARQVVPDGGKSAPRRRRRIQPGITKFF